MAPPQTTQIKIKRRTADATAPSGLTAGEMAINLVDKKLYVGGTAGTNTIFLDSTAVAGLGTANTFTQLNTFSAGISASGATFSATTASTSSTTGALIIAGGVGIAKDSFINSQRIGVGLLQDTTNLGIGVNALAGTTTGGFHNTAIGSGCGQAITSGPENTLLGYAVGSLITTGGYNCSIGTTSLNQNVSGNFNTAMGYGALQSTTASNNTAVGIAALQNITTGALNTAVGREAGCFQADGTTALTTANNSVYLGRDTRGTQTDSNSVVIGYQAIGLGANTTVIGTSSTTGTTIYGALSVPSTTASTSSTTGALIVSGGVGIAKDSYINGHRIGVGLLANQKNLAVGYNALNSTISGGIDNVAIGYQAGDALTTGSTNIAIGSDALGAAQTTTDCVAIGHNALLLNTVSGNIAIGARALDAVTTGTGNFAAGTDAASAITIGTNNFALGTNALKVATDVSDNVAIGKDALQAKSTSGNGNIAIGTSALYRATTCSTATAVGYQSQFGSAAVTGQGNSSLGYNSMLRITSASYNSAFGINALYSLTSGSQNTACGLESLYSITTTENNTGVGTSALRNITNGYYNTGIGHSAGRYKTASNVDHTLSGDSNIYIGYQSRASGDSVTKEVVIGSIDALGLGSNTTVIGTSTTLGNRIFGVASTGQVAPTIASATTIAPTTSIVFISGVTPIATITAPSTIATTGGQITNIPTGIFTTTTAGNIALASTAVVSRALIMTYDATTAKWYPSY